MSQLTRKKIMDDFEATRAKTFEYMAQALIEKLGVKEGKKAIKETTWKMSKSSGEKAKKSYQQKGIETTWESHRKIKGPIYAVAWEGGTTKNEPKLKVIEYSYCPLGAGFAKLGREAEELGDIYCSLVDDAFWAGFNPDWTVKREKTFSRDGVCRLVWRKKS